MKRIAMVLAVMMLIAFVARAQTAPPAPGPEVKKLGVFIGTWNGTGKAETSPFGKGGPTTSAMTCAWFTGGFQLVCDSDDTGPMGKVKSHSVYGYHAEKKQYFNFGIDSTGFGGPGTSKVDGSNWIFEANDVMGGKTYWFRTALKLVTPTELTYKSEISEDGKTWKLQAEGKMTKK